jgi:U3 small nucleolar RNA-associated protein 13
MMATKVPVKTTFEVDNVIRPIFSGGPVALDGSARLLATTLGEDVVLTDLKNGRQLARVEGDGEAITSLALTPSASHLVVCSRSLSMRIITLKSSAAWDSVDVSISRSLKPHTTPAVALAIDRTGTLLATGSADGAIKVWDILGGFVTHTFRGPGGLISALLFFEVISAHASDQNGTATGHVKKERRKSSEVTTKKEATEGFRLAIGTQDGAVRIWNLHKRNTAANLGSHVSSVQAIDFSPSQNTLVTVSRDKTIIWWDTRSWKIRKVVPCSELVEAAGFIGDGQLTFSAGSHGNLRIWDTDTGREVTAEQAKRVEGESITAAVGVPAQSIILCVQLDHTLALYKTTALEGAAVTADLPPLRPFRRLSGTHDDIIDLAYILPDKSLLALATNSESIRIVSANSGQLRSYDGDDQVIGLLGEDVGILAGHEDIVISLDTDWSGHWIATGGKDNTAKLWLVDPANDSYTCYATFTGHAESLGAVAVPKVASVPISAGLPPPPAFLITGSQDQTVKRWDIPSAPHADAKGLRAAYTRKAHDKDINALDISPDALLFASASQDRSVKIWSFKEGEVQGILRGHRRGVWTVRFAPAGLPLLQGEQGTVSGKGIILTGSGDKTVKIWSLSDYSCVRTFEGHSNSILKVAWLNLPEGDAAKSRKRILFASAGGDGLVKVWDADTGETECTLDNHEDRVWALAVHPATNMIVSAGGDSTVTFWKDTTEETRAAAAEGAEKLIALEQELQNYMNAGSYRDAITLALQLNHPGRLLKLFTSVTTSAIPDEDSLCGLLAVDEVLATLSDEQIFVLLLRLRDWNTNARTAPVAQKVLWTLVKLYPANRLSNLSIKGARGQKSLQEILHALRVYTERHYKRMEELVDESYLVEYSLQEMDSLAPLGDGDIVMAES